MMNQELYMQNSLEINDKYELLVSTLNLILLPVREIGIPYSDTLMSCLEELEGDYYTFLNEKYVYELWENGMLSENAVDIIKDIRLKIECIAQNKWNVKDFVIDKSWKEVRERVVDLYLLGLKFC